MDALTILLGLLLSITAALLPAAGWSALVWWCDRYEREPVPLGVGAFVWGALPAVILSLIAESLLGAPTALSGSALAGDLFVSSGVAPIVEELAKGAGLLFILLLWRVEFDNLLDGILYGSLVGFGFGLTENLLYFMAALADGGWGAWVFTVILRGVVFGLNHAFFTAFTGAGIGLARSAPAGSLRRWAPLLGLAAAILSHSLHNAGASLAAVSAAAILFSLLNAAMGITLVAAMIALALRHESHSIRAELSPEVGPLLSEDEYQALLSMRARFKMVAAARRAGGRAAVRAVRQFQELATELAFRKQRLRSRGNRALAEQVAALRVRVAQARDLTRSLLQSA